MSYDVIASQPIVIDNVSLPGSSALLSLGSVRVGVWSDQSWVCWRRRPQGALSKLVSFGCEKSYFCSNGLIVHLLSIARPKHTLVMAGGLEGETFIGAKAEVSTVPIGSACPFSLMLPRRLGTSRSDVHQVPY